ncbi:MAG: hypothetical protein KBF28_11120 [Gemmatimonadales bacterium]|nr:hypothetical protein [Gemmatimonadales bacterium]
MSAAADLTITGTTAEALAASVPGLLDRIAQLEAMLVEERAARIHYRQLALNGYGISRGSEWHERVASSSGVTQAAVERDRASARAEFGADNLMPSD